jgi:hypothetical protein
MKFSKLLAVVAMSIGASAVQAQQIRSATWSTDQFILRYKTMVEPPRPSGQELHIGGGGADDSRTQHRILTDSDNKKYFGYDLQVQQMGAGRFQLTFKPLSLPVGEKERMRLSADWSELPMPSVPATMQLNDGETVALDLLINPAAGEKIVEYITVSANPKTKIPAGAPRDLQLSDVQMSLTSPKLRINGKSLGWNHGDRNGTANGALLWFYVPDRGRFLLSLVPHSGFRQTGEARGAVIRFSWNGESYELDTDGNVAPAEGAFNLYIYPDPGYQPQGRSPALYGAGDKPEQLLRRP